MKACVIAYTIYETDFRVRRYAEALVEEGYSVDAIALQGPGEGKRGHLNGVEIYRVQRRAYDEKGALSFFKNYLKFFLKGCGILIRGHAKGRYDVIHIHNIPDFLVFMGLIPRLAGAKLILDIHDVVPEFFCQKFGKGLDSWHAKLLLLIEKASVRFADHVIAANDIWRERIIKRDSVAPDRCTALLNYPRLDFFLPHVGGGKGDGFTLIYPGTVSEQHGLDVAVKALAIVKKRVPGVRLDIYQNGGSAGFRKRIDGLVKDLGLEENVAFFKPVAPEALGDAFARADVGIVPKRDGVFAGEAFSTKILDFMAAGVPVAASRTRIDEYYFDDTQIKFFEPGDPEDMARSVCELYEKPALRKTLSENGKRFVERNNWLEKKGIYLRIIDGLRGGKDRLSVRLIDPLTDRRWDGFVEGHPFGSIYHLSGWQRVLEKSFGHIKGYCQVLLDENGEIRSALPVYRIKSWLMGTRLVSIPFAELSDPLVSGAEDMRRLIDATLDLSTKLGASHVELRTFLSSGFMSGNGLAEERYYKHHYIPLEGDPEDLKKTFDRTCVRQRISRAMKSGLRLVDASGEEELKKFYRLHVITRKRNGLPPQPYAFFRNIWETFCPSGRLKVLIAEHDGEAVAGLILLKFKERVSAEFAASDDRFQGMSPNHFLFWESIKSASAEGYRVFDFGRTAPSNKGLMEFKGRWGTKVVDLPYYYSNGQLKASAGRETSGAYRLINRICGKTPDFALPFIGNFFYRHLG